MRVITGFARGRRLLTPPDSAVRPTTDKVKESLFNIIRFDLPDSVVLDLFAGTGQLGIEAISGGAAKAVFVDSSKKSLELVKKNLEICLFSDKAQSFLSDAFDFLANTALKFDIVFLDPPYHKELCLKALEGLSHVLNDGALVICETQADEILPEKIDGIELCREYKYSTIKLTVYKYGM